MKQIQLRAAFKIHDGKSNEFKALASEAIVNVKANEPGNLQYEWYFNEDNTECVAHERYADSNAVFAHAGNVGELLGKLGQVSDLSLEVYGNPSEELKKLIVDMKGKLYSFYPG